MKISRMIHIALALALGAIVFAPRARAQGPEWKQLTKVTFSVPVQVPGRILGAGTYWFEVADPSHSVQVVQILNEKKQLVTSLLAQPAYRLTTRMTDGDDNLVFSEKGAGPPAVKEWFYPTQLVGHEFDYGHR